MSGYGFAAKMFGKGAKEAEKDALEVEKAAIKPRSLFDRAGGVMSGVGTAGAVVAGGLAAREAFDDLEDLQRMGGFFKFLMECISDPAHIEKYFNEWMTGKTEEKRVEVAKDHEAGVKAAAIGAAAPEVKFDDVSGAGVSKPMKVVSTSPNAPEIKTVAVDGESVGVKNYAGLSQTRDVAGAVVGSLGASYAEAFGKDGQLGKVYEFHSQTANGGEFVERVVALDKDHFVLAKDGLGAGFGVSPFEGQAGHEKLEQLRQGLASGQVEKEAASLGRVYDVRDHVSAGSSVRFGALMNEDDLGRLNAAVAPLGDFSVSANEHGFWKKGPDSQTRAEFVSVSGEPKLDFVGENGRLLSIGGSKGEMIALSKQDGEFKRSAFVSGINGVNLDASGKLGVSEGAGRTLAAAGLAIGTRSRLELEAGGASVKGAEMTTMLDGAGHTVGQMMSFRSADGRQGAVVLQNGRAMYVGEDGQMRVVEDKGIKVDGKTGAVDLGNEVDGLRSFLQSPEAGELKSKGMTSAIGASPAEYIESLKRGDQIMGDQVGGEDLRIRVASKDNGVSR